MSDITAREQDCCCVSNLLELAAVCSLLCQLTVVSASVHAVFCCSTEFATEKGASYEHTGISSDYTHSRFSNSRLHKSEESRPKHTMFANSGELPGLYTVAR